MMNSDKEVHEKNIPPNLKDNIHKILHGNKEEKEKLTGKFFHIADTPQFMKDMGLTGDYFSIRYGVISRHTGKDKDHALSENNWKELCDAITKPFAIAKYGKGYRLFTTIKLEDSYVVAGVDVKNIGRGIDINYVSTAFSYDHSRKEDIIYRAKNITPEQTALLDGPNSLSLPSVQGSISNISQSGEKSSNLSREIETARKAGYVQGVCECVAAIGDNHTLEKKLLSEMKVTKDIAKKYAKPETFKDLEQGIFAAKPEQKQEQTQGIKR